MSLELTSAAFESGKTIPARYTCDGADVSPPLAWSGVTSNAKRLVLICDDPDTTSGFTRWTRHWIWRRVSHVCKCWITSRTTSWRRRSSWGCTDAANSNTIGFLLSRR